MIMSFLRENIWASGVLTVLRVWLGWSWLTSGWGKAMNGFDASGYLNNAAANPVMSPAGEVVYPTYVSFLENIAVPYADIFSFMVAWGEVLVGLGLILGCFTTVAAFFGVVMNFSFMFAGTVSTNPIMILVAFFILAAGYNAGRIGLDRWVIPFIKGLVNKALGKENNAV